MAGIYNPWLVVLSVAVAIFVSHAAVRLSANGVPSKLWLIGGALAMGSGVWSMHFIGMPAFPLPIALAYNIPTTIASLFIAVIASAFALALANRPRFSLAHLRSAHCCSAAVSLPCITSVWLRFRSHRRSLTSRPAALDRHR